MLLTIHFRSWVSTIPSLIRRVFMFLLLVSSVQVLYNITLLTNYLVLHPYYKLAYIQLAWGGADKEKREHKTGNLNAKDWHDKALQVVHKPCKTIGINKLKRAMVKVKFPYLAKLESSTLLSQSMITIIISFLDSRHYMPILVDGRKNYNNIFIICLVM